MEDFVLDNIREKDIPAAPLSSGGNRGSIALSVLELLQKWSQPLFLLKNDHTYGAEFLINGN